MTNDSTTSDDQQLILRDVRALLDQLQLDRNHTLTMASQLTEELGVDSLALVELCDQLERTFDVSLPDEVFLFAATPQQWLDAVVASRAGVSPTSRQEHRGEGRDPPPRSFEQRARAASKRVSAGVGAPRARRWRSASGPHTSAPSGSMPYALYAWVVLVPFAFSVWMLAVLPLTLSRRRRAARAVARVVCRALGLSVTVEGALPTADHPSVIAANHASFIDGLVLYVFMDQPLTFVASADMQHQLFLGRIMRGFGCLFVERGRAERSAASVALLVSAIRSGHHVLIFPEGSISNRPGLRVFRLGAFETAASSNSPVIPVGLRGSRDVLRPGSFLPRRGAVHVAVGDAIRAAGREFGDRVALRDEVRDAIAQLSGQAEA